MQGPTLRKPAHLQLSTAAAGRETPAVLAIRIAIECGHFLVHWLRSTISISLEMGFVEVASLNGSAGGGCATETLQLSSEQTYKTDVRHQYPSTDQRQGVRLGSLVSLAHRLGNARVLNSSIRALKVACSLSSCVCDSLQSGVACLMAQNVQCVETAT